VNPRTGSLHLSLSITNFDNAFVGVFQDVLGVTSGVSYTFSGWHMTSSSPFDATIDIRIEWRDSVNNIEISRTANLPVVLTGSYAQFVLDAVAPAGADTARVVYAIQTFGPEPTNTGTAFVDDAWLVQTVPEPASVLLLGASLGGLAVAARLARLRRRGGNLYLA
jgi:hypothetical protein